MSVNKTPDNMAKVDGNKTSSFHSITLNGTAPSNYREYLGELVQDFTRDKARDPLNRALDSIVLTNNAKGMFNSTKPTSKTNVGSLVNNVDEINTTKKIEVNNPPSSVTKMELKVDIDSKIELKANLDPEAKFELKLEPEQIPHFTWCCQALGRQHHIIDVSPTGAGKTINASCIAHHFNLPVLVISLVNSIPWWTGVLVSNGIPYYDIISFQTLRSKRGLDPKHEWLIRNDYVITDDEGKSTEKLEFILTPKMQAIVNSGVLLIVDEIHHIKNDNAQHKAVAAICAAIRNSSLSRYLLISATPMDQEDQVIPYMKLLGYLDQDKPLFAKLKSGDYEPYGADRLIRKCYSIDRVRTKSIQSLVGKPNQKKSKNLCYRLFIEIIKPTLVSAMPALEIKIDGKTITNDVKNGFYRMEEKDMINLNERIAELVARTGYDERTGLTITHGFETFTPQLVTIEKAKIPIFVRLARGNLVPSDELKNWATNKKDLLTQDFSVICRTANADDIEKIRQLRRKVIISVNYIDTSSLLMQQLAEFNPLLVRGEVGAKERKHIFNAFQTDPRCRLLICSTMTIAESISLHDVVGDSPRFMYISPSYQMLLISQAIGRPFRHGLRSQGQTRIVYCLGADKEFGILTAMMKKSDVTKDMISSVVGPNRALLPGEFPMEEEL